MNIEIFFLGQSATLQNVLSIEHVNEVTTRFNWPPDVEIPDWDDLPDEWEPHLDISGSGMSIEGPIQFKKS
jgi:hypothetical protein